VIDSISNSFVVIFFKKKLIFKFEFILFKKGIKFNEYSRKH
jgi:hypothetical protein